MSKLIALSREEASDMINYYQEEQILLTRKLAHVNAMIEKLGGASAPPTFETGGKKTRPIIASAVASVDMDDDDDDDASSKRKRKKKRGPKSVWGAFILKRLRQVDRPVSYSDMLNYAMVFHAIPEEKRENARASILNSAFRLRAVHKKIDTVGEDGKKEKYLVLSRWTDGNGNLIDPYDKKFAEIVK
jgi:hypothetical protein